MKKVSWKSKIHITNDDGIRTKCGAKIPEVLETNDETTECRMCFGNVPSKVKLNKSIKIWKCLGCKKSHPMYKVFCIPGCHSRNHNMD